MSRCPECLKIQSTNLKVKERWDIISERFGTNLENVFVLDCAVCGHIYIHASHFVLSMTLIQSLTEFLQELAPWLLHRPSRQGSVSSITHCLQHDPCIGYPYSPRPLHTIDDQPLTLSQLETAYQCLWVVSIAVRDTPWSTSAF